MRARHPLFVLFLLLFVAGFLVLRSETGGERALLLSFDAAAVLFIAAQLIIAGRASPDRLRRTAAGNDAGRVLLLLVAAISLAAVFVVVGRELGRTEFADAGEVVFLIATLTVAWLFGNLVYAIHYAHMFYDSQPDGRDHGGLVFPTKDEPDFLDFCYFAFVLGMTFQVSDVQIASRRIRRVATVHALLAFLFNIGIVALTVNVVASAVSDADAPAGTPIDAERR